MPNEKCAEKNFLVFGFAFGLSSVVCFQCRGYDLQAGRQARKIKN